MTRALPVRETLEDAVNPAHTALLVIDTQYDLQGEDGPAMFPRLERLIGAARDAGVYVVYTQNVMLPDGLSSSPAELARRRKLGRTRPVTVDGSPGCQIVELLAPRPGDAVVRKHRMNCFVGTNLDLLLRCRGIETVVCTGIATHGCVLNTAYAALAHDYYVGVVDDCVAMGAAIGPELQEAARVLLRSAMHLFVDSGRLIDVWRSKSG